MRLSKDEKVNILMEAPVGVRLIIGLDRASA
jgi:hypothetical protein